MSEPGSVAEEATRLLGALEQWARERTEGVSGALGDEHLANGSAACAVCPVCQAIAAVRSVNPQTVEHLLDAAASVVAALRSTVGEHQPPTAPDGPVVERIVVRDSTC